jgi:hypothetical protein
MGLPNYITNIRKIPSIKLDDKKPYNVKTSYDFLENTWLSLISVYQSKLVKNSNHFYDLSLTDSHIFQELGDLNIKRKPSYIYSRIYNNYNKVINDKTDPIVIDDQCIFIHNSFSEGNAGHDLCCILDILIKHSTNQTLKYVLCKEINNKNNLEIIKLFIDESKFIYIEQKHIYNFNNLIFNYEIAAFQMTNFSDIIKEIQKRIITKFEQNNSDYQDYKNKKVIIIKHIGMDKIVRPEDKFDANILLEYLSNNGWYTCNPEKDDFFKMSYTLLNASVIVTADRGISCANQIFYNLNALIIGFQLNTIDNIEIFNDNKKTKYDFMCNSLYHHLIKKVILAPLIIKQEHIEIIKNIFSKI